MGRGWFQDESSSLHILCTLFLSLLHQHHLRSRGIRSWMLGTPALENKMDIPYQVFEILSIQKYVTVPDLFCGESFGLKMRSPELESQALRKFLNHSGSQFLFLLVEDIMFYLKVAVDSATFLNTPHFQSAEPWKFYILGIFTVHLSLPRVFCSLDQAPTVWCLSHCNDLADGLCPQSCDFFKAPSVFLPDFFFLRCEPHPVPSPCNFQNHLFIFFQ